MTASVTFIWTALVERSRWKYRQRAYRYIYLDAGHIGENLYLAGGALGLGVCAIGAFYANDLFFLLLCWEVLTLLLYLLINLGSEDYAPAGATKTFTLLGFSDCALLLGVVLVLTTQGTLQMDQLKIVTNSPSGVLTFADPCTCAT